jgi:hypothetical protein
LQIKYVEIVTKTTDSISPSRSDFMNPLATLSFRMRHSCQEKAPPKGVFHFTFQAREAFLNDLKRKPL